MADVPFAFQDAEDGANCGVTGITRETLADFLTGCPAHGEKDVHDLAFTAAEADFGWHA
jgi:hypothetical protein